MHAHGLLHWLLGWTGAWNESSAAYGFWSGFGSDFGEIPLLGAVWILYRKHNCGIHRCWRIAHRAVPGTDHVVCRRHHPHPAPTHGQMLTQHYMSKGDRHD